MGGNPVADLRSDRAKRDAALMPEVQRVHRENFEVYGVRKVWRQMLREGFNVARCTVERLMQHLELKGVIRANSVRTTTCLVALRALLRRF